MASSKKSKKRRIPALEWLSAIIGLVIVAGMLGFLVLEALRESPATPPLMSVEPVRLVSFAGGYIVEVRVRNGSGSTGSAVQVEGVLGRNGKDIETSTITLDYVPGNSQRRGGLIFRNDPRQARVGLRIVGYEQP